MPLKHNGVLIENTLVAILGYDNIEKADDGDTRQRAFCNHEYIKGFPPFLTRRIWNSAATRDLFKVNGEAVLFAYKGERPRFNLRATITEIGVDYYIVKIADGSIWLTTDASVTKDSTGLSTTDTQFELIPASAQVRKPLLEIIGAGGGGSGGGTALNGVGGGAGAYFLGAWDLRSWTSRALRLRITASGGAGSSNRGKAGDGGDVEAQIVGDGLVWTVGGGKGADGGTVGAGGESIPSIGNGVVLYGENGSNGYAGLSGDHTFEQITVRCGYEGETQCEKVYGPYTSNSNEAGGGGNSFMGAGGSAGSAYGDDGGDAGGYGAGGGGGRMKPFGSTTGGNGGGAVINIYY